MVKKMSDFKTDVERIVMYMININGIALHEEEKAHKILDEAKKYFINYDKQVKKIPKTEKGISKMDVKFKTKRRPTSSRRITR